MSVRHSPITSLAAALLLSLGAANPTRAADPPGSTPTAPRTPAAEPTAFLPPVGPSPRPTLHGISVPLPPPSFSAPSAAKDAEVDQAIGALILLPGGGPAGVSNVESREDFLYSTCQEHGGGASSDPDDPDGVACYDPDGNEVFDP